jgi:hypothetical protein
MFDEVTASEVDFNKYRLQVGNHILHVSPKMPSSLLYFANERQERISFLIADRSAHFLTLLTRLNQSKCMNSRLLLENP